MKTSNPPRVIRPTSETWTSFIDSASAAVRLVDVLGTDFEHAREELALNDGGYTRRNIVRCFGSLLDVLSSTLREVSCNLADAFGKPHNRYLRDKSNERATTASFRVKTSYRLVADLMPDSPFARVDPVRWDQLHYALEVRNRIMHPHATTDTEISDDELRLITATALEFLMDLGTFFKFVQLHTQQLFWDAGGRRVRMISKIGRNEECLCHSRKKYKQCCGRAQWA